MPGLRPGWQWVLSVLSSVDAWLSVGLGDLLYGFSSLVWLFGLFLGQEAARAWQGLARPRSRCGDPGAWPTPFSLREDTLS